MAPYSAKLARMKKRVSVYLTESEYQFVERKAREWERPMTEAIRRFIDEAAAAEKATGKGKV